MADANVPRKRKKILKICVHLWGKEEIKIEESKIEQVLSFKIQFGSLVIGWENIDSRWVKSYLIEEIEINKN